MSCRKMSGINPLIVCFKSIDHYKAYESEPRGLSLEKLRVSNEIKRKCLDLINNK